MKRYQIEKRFYVYNPYTPQYSYWSYWRIFGDKIYSTIEEAVDTIKNIGIDFADKTEFRVVELN